MANITLDPTQLAQLQRSITEDVQRQIERRFMAKQLDEGTYNGPMFVGRNGQVLRALKGGQNYGFPQRTIEGFEELIGPVVPMQITRRFRVGGFLAHFRTPPDVDEDTDLRASFDIQLAPVGTADDGTWTSIFDAADGSGLYHVAGADRTWTGIDVPMLKTESTFYESLDIPVLPQVANQYVSIHTGWAMRCVLKKYDVEDDDDAFGTLAGVTIMVSMDLAE